MIASYVHSFELDFPMLKFASEKEKKKKGPWEHFIQDCSKAEIQYHCNSTTNNNNILLLLLLLLLFSFMRIPPMLLL